MPNLVTLKTNAPVRAMDEGVLDLQTRTTELSHEYIRPNRARRKAR